MLVLALAIFGVAATSLLLTIALFAAFWRFGRARHAIWWSAAFCLFTLDHTLMAIRLLTSGAHLGITLFSTLGSLGGATLLALGFRQRSGLLGAWLLGAVFLVMAAVCSALILRFPVMPVHRPLVSAYVVAMLLLGMDALRKGPRQGLAAGRVTLAMVGVFSVFFIALTLLGLVTVPWGSLGPDPYRAAYLLGVPASLTGMGLFALFLLAEDLAHAMKQLATIDPLTGLLNRRGFEEGARRVKAQCRRDGVPLCVAIGDLDHFKSINDRFGHKEGDRVLVAFAGRLRDALRESDLISRLGGEEFVFLLPGVAAGRVGPLLDRLRLRLREVGAADPLDVTMPTASFGAAEMRPGEPLSACIERADLALYRAKRDGRDCVRIDGEHHAELSPSESDRRWTSV